VVSGLRWRPLGTAGFCIERGTASFRSWLPGSTACESLGAPFWESSPSSSSRGQRCRGCTKESRISQLPATILGPAPCLWCGRPGGTCRRDARTPNLLAVGFFHELIKLPRHEVEAFLQAFGSTPCGFLGAPFWESSPSSSSRGQRCRGCTKESRISQSPTTILGPALCLWFGRPGGTCRRDARTPNLLAVGFFQELIELPRHEVEAFLQAFDAALEVGNVVARLPGVGFFCLVA
jgi:hypothetical protein